MQTKRQIQAILKEAGLSPRHRLGQNFMIDGNLLRRVVEAGRPAAGETVVEIGPGTGSLTEELLASGCGVVAVEIDRGLAGVLRGRLGAKSNLTLIEADALSGKHSLSGELLSEIKASHPLKLIANLPYQIASPLVIEMLIAGADLLAFTVQKEVAQRLCAAAGSERYGPLSVMAQLLAGVEILRKLPAEAFWPRPKIESALVRMTRQDRLGGQAAEFGAFVHGVFSYRRKTLGKALEEAGADPGAIEKIKLSPRMRPEELEPPRWLELFWAGRGA